MIVKYIAFAAAFGLATGASARPLNGASHLAAPAKATQSRHAVLDNIISRVQMDALIAQVVAPAARPVAVAKRDEAGRGRGYAAAGVSAARNRG